MAIGDVLEIGYIEEVLLTKFPHSAISLVAKSHMVGISRYRAEGEDGDILLDGERMTVLHLSDSGLGFIYYDTVEVFGVRNPSGRPLVITGSNAHSIQRRSGTEHWRLLGGYGAGIQLNENMT